VNTIDAVKQTLLRSGASWVLWFLGALSLVSVAIIVERWLFLTGNGAADVAGMRGGSAPPGARRSPGGARRARGVELRRRRRSPPPACGSPIAGPAPAERAMQSAAALERVRLERWLAYLGTLGNKRALHRLFGTVIGVIGAFEALGRGPWRRTPAARPARPRRSLRKP